MNGRGSAGEFDKFMRRKMKQSQLSPMPLELNFVGLMYETRDSSMSQLGLSERGVSSVSDQHHQDCFSAGKTRPAISTAAVWWQINDGLTMHWWREDAGEKIGLRLEC